MERGRLGCRATWTVSHGVSVRAFVMMWCHKSPEWLEDEKNPGNCAVRLIDDDGDQGYIFEGF